MEQLINLIINFIDLFYVCFIVDDYQNAIILRRGKYTGRIYTSGIYFRLPFGIDEVIKQHTVTTTISLPVQSLTSTDNQQVIIKGVVKYRVDNVAPFILEIYDSVDAVVDTAQGIIATEICKRTWDEIRTEDIDNEITKRLRSGLKKWGIYIDTVTLTDKTISRSYRLFNESNLT